MRERPDPSQYFGPDPGTVPLDERILLLEERLRQVLTRHASRTAWDQCDGSVLLEAARELQVELPLCARLEFLYARRRLRDSLTLDLRIHRG